MKILYNEFKQMTEVVPTKEFLLTKGKDPKFGGACQLFSKIYSKIWKPKNKTVKRSGNMDASEFPRPF